MLKQAKKQKEVQNKHEELNLADEEREPCLHAMQKKVRNLNKKYGEIQELKKKSNLKPEQVEKVKSEAEVATEIQRFTEFSQIYENIVHDNQQKIRRNKLSELENLAYMISARQYGVCIGSTQDSQIDAVITLLTSSDLHNLTLKERAIQLCNAFFSLAEDVDLKKTVKSLLNQNQSKVIALSNRESSHEKISQQNDDDDNEKKVKKDETTAATPQKANQSSQNEQHQKKIKYVEKQEENERSNNKQNNNVKSGNENQNKGKKSKEARESHQNGEKIFKEKNQKPQYRQKPKKKYVAKEDYENGKLGFREKQVQELVEDGYTIVEKKKKQHQNKQTEPRKNKNPSTQPKKKVQYREKP